MSDQKRVLGGLRRALSAGRRPSTPPPVRMPPGEVPTDLPTLVARFDATAERCLSWLPPSGPPRDVPALAGPAPPAARLAAAHPADRARTAARLAEWLADPDEGWLVLDYRALDEAGDERRGRSLFLREQGASGSAPGVIELTWIATAGEAGLPGGGLGAVSDLALQLAAAPVTADVHRLVSEELREVTAAVAVVISTFERTRGRLVVRAVAAGEGLLAGAAKLLGQRVVGFELPVPAAALEVMRSTIVSEPAGLHELSFGTVPKPVAAAIHRSLRIGQIVALSLLDGRELMGTMSVLLPPGRSAPPPEVLRSFALLASAALRRQQAELALRRGEARLQAVAACVSDVIWTVDSDLRYTYVSPSVATMFGYSAEEATGLPLFHSVAPESRGLAERRTARALAVMASAQRPSSIELQAQELEQVRKDGSRLWTEVKVSPLLDESGRVSGLVGVTRDVTLRRQAAEQRERMESRLRATQKLEALGRMAAGVAHDFNNLLTVVLANAGLALAEMSTDAAGRGAVLDVEEAARRAARLAQQILAYSGAGTFRVRPVDVSELVESTQELLASALPREKARLELELQRGLPRVEVDVSQIREALLSLVVNAGEAIAEAGRPTEGLVTISTGTREVDSAVAERTCSEAEPAPGLYVHVTVADDGAGMNDQTLAHLFEPFYTTKFTGRGLGLSAAAGILRGHGGLVCASSALGQGATVSLLLPTAPAAERREGAAARRGAVLVVDEEPALRAVARRMLERAGCAVLEARTTAEAVETCREVKGRVRVILMDPTMPRSGGPEAALDLAATTGGARLVVMSGLPPEEAIVGLEAPELLGGYVQKPFLAEELLAVVLPALRD